MLANRDDRDWVDVLPGVMLVFNEIEQENHGYTAFQVMWGKNVNLPADLIHSPDNDGKSDLRGYAKSLERELKKIRKKVAPFNRAYERPQSNPFKSGDLILIYQQQMEKSHKLSPRWRGPFPVIKTPNSFQVVYMDDEREKISHISDCKRFREKNANAGKEAPPPARRHLNKTWSNRREVRTRLAIARR